MGKSHGRDARGEGQEGSREAGDLCRLLWASAGRKRAGRAFQREGATIHQADRSGENTGHTGEGAVAGEEVGRCTRPLKRALCAILKTVSFLLHDLGNSQRILRGGR